MEVDVPRIVEHNGETLTFGDYRRASLLERATITLSALGAVGWKASCMFRSMRQTWSKASLAIAAPCVAWLLRSVVFYLYREAVLRPKLRSAESVAFPNSRFEDIDGLKVHYLRETPKKAAGEDEMSPTSSSTVLHMSHGFGASSLSWMPVIGRLSEALGAVTAAHDTPGFGLTARAGLWNAERYSLRSDAAIARHLLRSAAEELDGAAAAAEREDKSAPPRRYVLMGHSMGCITAATVSLDPSLPPEQTTLVVVSPALSLPSNKKIKKNKKSARFAAGAAGEGAPGEVPEAPQVPEHARASTSGAAGGDGGGGGGGGGGEGGVAIDRDFREGVLPRGGAGVGRESRARRGRGRGRGGRDLAEAVVGAPVCAVRAVRDVGAWVFNWCLLPALYPFEILGLRALVYRGNFWRKALRLAWFRQSGVDVDVINRYRWPSLVRHWDRGMALFLLDRTQLGRGGAVGPSGLVAAVAAKAAQGMKVVVVQGENDAIVSLAKAKAVAAAIPGAKLVVLPECGHVPHEEKPEEFLRTVLGQL